MIPSRRRSWIFLVGLPLLVVTLVAASQPLTTEETEMNALPCTEGNRSVLKQRLQRVLGAVPAFVGGPLCLKTAYSSDMIAAVQLDPATALPGWSFARYAPPEEVPVEELFRIWPDVFDATARQGLEIAIGFDPVSGAGITLSRLPDGRLYVLLSDRM